MGLFGLQRGGPFMGTAYNTLITTRFFRRRKRYLNPSLVHADCTHAHILTHACTHPHMHACMHTSSMLQHGPHHLTPSVLSNAPLNALQLHACCFSALPRGSHPLTPSCPLLSRLFPAPNIPKPNPKPYP